MVIKGISDELNEFYFNYPPSFFEQMLKINGKSFIPYIYQLRPIMWMTLAERDLPDQQREVGLLWGRQSGKTETTAGIGTWFAFMHDYTNTVILSPRQKRSNAIMKKMKEYIRQEPTLRAMSGKDNRDLSWSKDTLELSNGATIFSYPEGEDAESIVGETIHLGIVDEVAKFKNQDSIKAALRPALFASDGVLVMLSSSWGRDGKGAYWYEIVNSPDVEVYNVNSCDALHDQFILNTKILGFDRAISILDKKFGFLTREKSELGKYMFEMQYMNSFAGGINSVFEPEDVELSFNGKFDLPRAELSRSYEVIVDWGKSRKTGDKTVISVWDVTDPNDILSVRMRGYSEPYTRVLPKIVNHVIAFAPQHLFVDIGGGEAQLEWLTGNLEVQRLGTEVIGLYQMGGEAKKENQWMDKGVTKRSFQKNSAVRRLASHFENAWIRFGNPKFKDQFIDYVQTVTERGNVTFGHPPSGHDDAVDTAIMLMGVLGNIHDTWAGGVGEKRNVVVREREREKISLKGRIAFGISKKVLDGGYFKRVI